jgi:hypothetical protein
LGASIEDIKRERLKIGASKRYQNRGASMDIQNKRRIKDWRRIYKISKKRGASK